MKRRRQDRGWIHRPALAPAAPNSAPTPLMTMRRGRAVGGDDVYL
jgi:hypothetical protein